MSMIRCGLVLLCQQVAHNKTIREEKTCLIIKTDVNMTSKRAFRQKVTMLLNSTTETRVGWFLLLYVPSQQLWSLRDGQFT